jgi:hypothetical protein
MTDTETDATEIVVIETGEKERENERRERKTVL